jgi:hypothetical protein
MKQYFTGEGRQLFAIGIAEEGLSEQIKVVYELIITGYQLPGMGGLDFMETIQGESRPPIKTHISSHAERESW